MPAGGGVQPLLRSSLVRCFEAALPAGSGACAGAFAWSPTRTVCPAALSADSRCPSPRLRCQNSCIAWAPCRPRSFRFRGSCPSSVRIVSRASASRRLFCVLQSVAIASASLGARLPHACSRLCGSSSCAAITSYTSRAIASCARASFPSMICAVVNTVSGLLHDARSLFPVPSGSHLRDVKRSLSRADHGSVYARLRPQHTVRSAGESAVGSYRFRYGTVRVGGRQVDVVALAVLPSCGQYGAAAQFIAPAFLPASGGRVELLPRRLAYLLPKRSGCRRQRERLLLGFGLGLACCRASSFLQPLRQLSPPVFHRGISANWLIRLTVPAVSGPVRSAARRNCLQVKTP